MFKNVSCLDDSFLENHKLHLVYLIYKEFLKIRLHYIAKSKDKQVRKRRVLTKLILFNNQQTIMCKTLLILLYCLIFVYLLYLFILYDNIFIFVFYNNIII